MNYPNKILMVSPEFYQIAYVINDHMKMDEKVDKETAQKQWSELRQTYMSLGLEVIVIAGKGAETTQEISGKVIPFDDRVIAVEALQGVKG